MESDRRFRFTQKAIAALDPPESGHVYYYDTYAPGLAIRLSKTGRVSWVWCGDGKRETLKARSLDHARKLAMQKTALRNTSKSDADLWTFQEVFDLWLEQHAKPKKRTWKRDVARFNQYLKPWASRRLSAVKRLDVVSIHNEIAKKSGEYAANDTIAFIASLYSFAEKFDYSGRNPAKRIDRFPEQSRERYLLPEEFPRWHKAVMSLRVSEARDFFLLALWTGVRRQAVLSMQWDRIDLESGVWRIPREADKTKRDLIVYLSEEAIKVLKRRKAHATTEFVLPSTQSRSGHYEEPKAAWKQVCEAAGLTDLRIHDLRRTLGSWMAEGGTSLHIIGKALGHASTDATTIYARLGSNSVRSAVNSAISAMTATLGAGEEKNSK